MEIRPHSPPHVGYLDGTKRLYGVQEIHLQNRDSLTGSGTGALSIADINVPLWSANMFSLYRGCMLTGTLQDSGPQFPGIPCLDKFPRLKAWFDRIEARWGNDPKGSMNVRWMAVGLHGY